MKYIVSILLMSALLFSCSTNNKEAATDAEQAKAMPAPEKPEKTVYPEDSVSEDGTMSFHGLRINDSEAVSVSEVKEMVMESEGEMSGVKVAASIDKVCQAKGCWMTLMVDEEETMHVTFKDYGFFVPKDAMGKTAIVEGRVYTDTASVEELRHYAEDEGMSPDEAAEKITEPEVRLAFKATGVIIKDEEGR